MANARSADDPRPLPRPLPPALAQEALAAFDEAGEAAALRYMLDQFPVGRRREDGSHAWTLDDGSSVSHNPETGSYEFVWDDQSRTRRQPPAAIFGWLTADAVLHQLLLAIETEAAPSPERRPSRGDDPLTEIPEAAVACPGLLTLLRDELAAYDPPDFLTEDLNHQVQMLAGRLLARLDPESRQSLLTLAREKIDAATS